MNIPKSFIAFVILWPLALMWFWQGYESTLETVIPARFHEKVMPWHLYVYPWGFNGPYERTGPHLTFGGCREEGLDQLNGYMRQWPAATFEAAKFTCSQRCRFRIENTDQWVCARVEQFNVQGAKVGGNGI